MLAEFPDSTWAGEALNNLGTHYIVTNQDDLAAQTFKELFETFPERPARRALRVEVRLVGLHHRQLRRDRARVREGRGELPALRLPPAVPYWAARAREKMGERDTAQARMRLVYTDYMNSYYGRLANRRLPAARAETADGAGAAGRRAARLAARGASRAGPRSAAHRRAHPPAPRRGPLRRRAERAAVRAEGVGHHAGDRGDDGVGVSPAGGSAPRHHRDAPRLSAVPRGRRRRAAAADPAGHLSADLLGVDQAERRAPRSRSLHRRRADRAGVDVRRRPPARAPTRGG